MQSGLIHALVLLILAGGAYACKSSSSNSHNLSGEGGSDAAEQDSDNKGSDDGADSNSLSMFSERARAFLDGDLDATPCEQTLVSGNPCLVSSFVWQQEVDQEQESQEEEVMGDTWLRDYEEREAPPDKDDKDLAAATPNTVTHAALPYQYQDKNVSVSFTENGLLVMPELWQVGGVVEAPSATTKRQTQCAPPPGCDGSGPCPAMCYEGPSEPPNQDTAMTFSYPQASLYADIVKPGQGAEFTVAAGEVAMRVHVIAYAKPRESACSPPYRVLIYNPKNPQDEYAYLFTEGACWQMASTAKSKQK